MYGPIKKIILIHDVDSGKPRGYSFIEYEHERDMHGKLSQQFIPTENIVLRATLRKALDSYQKLQVKPFPRFFTAGGVEFMKKMLRILVITAKARREFRKTFKGFS